MGLESERTFGESPKNGAAIDRLATTEYTFRVDESGMAGLGLGLTSGLACAVVGLDQCNWSQHYWGVSEKRDTGWLENNSTAMSQQIFWETQLVIMSELG